jgi:hypothetical protein
MAKVKRGKTCRYWSDRIARAVGGAQIEAVCLSPASPFNSAYTDGEAGCPAWKDAPFGSIDESEANAALYPGKVHDDE